MSERPTMRVSAITNALDLDHYVLAAYDSSENFNKHIVVVVPHLSEPTWVLPPRVRKFRRSTVLALAVPSLGALTLELAQEATGVLTDYITVRPLSRESRQRGSLNGGMPIRVWER